jgi:hypothetical protein
MTPILRQLARALLASAALAASRIARRPSPVLPVRRFRNRAGGSKRLALQAKPPPPLTACFRPRDLRGHDLVMVVRLAQP